MCSILPVEYNVGPVQCSVDPVESNIDIDHVKFSWVWLCQPFLTPMVENEELAEVGNKCGQRLSEVLAETNER